MSRTGWAVVLAVAVVLLVGSVAAVAIGTGHRAVRAAAVVGAADERPGSGWRSGMMDGGMMDGGMMGAWDGSVDTIAGTGPVTAAQARTAAQAWVDKYAPGATLGDGRQTMRGYRFPVTKDGIVVAHVMVDDETGTAAGRVLSDVSG